jgi:hypothetical protein
LEVTKLKEKVLNNKVFGLIIIAYVGRAVKGRINAYYKANGINEFRDFSIEAVGGESLFTGNEIF